MRTRTPNMRLCTKCNSLVVSSIMSRLLTVDHLLRDVWGRLPLAPAVRGIIPIYMRTVG